MMEVGTIEGLIAIKIKVDAVQVEIDEMLLRSGITLTKTDHGYWWNGIAIRNPQKGE